MQQCSQIGTPDALRGACPVWGGLGGIPLSKGSTDAVLLLHQQPREPAGEAGGPEALRQDSFVERFRGDPSQPPQPVRVLEGLLGNSDREGYLRLYFTREFDSYAEFRAEDYVYREPIPADQPPFIGLDASRVAIKRDAPIWYTQVRVPRPVDEFDLDVRLGAATGARTAIGQAPDTFIQCPATIGIECPTQPFGCATDQTCGCPTNEITICRGATCADTCRTCDTCRTQCGQATCAATCQTCQTRCNQATCNTCNTCNTQCGQATCEETCRACTHIFTQCC